MLSHYVGDMLADPRHVGWAIVDGDGRIAAGTTPMDPNRGDPFGAIADDVAALAQQHAQQRRRPIGWWAGTPGGGSHHSGTAHTRPDHWCTVVAELSVDPT